MLLCRNCNGTETYTEAATGTTICVHCSVVIEENAIVAEVAFGESSSGAAIAYGKNVAAGAGAYALPRQPFNFSDGYIKLVPVDRSSWRWWARNETADYGEWWVLFSADPPPC
jgi:hypothetical protein